MMGIYLLKNYGNHAVFKIVFKRRAEKQFRKLSKKLQTHIKQTLDRLSIDPYTSSDPFDPLKGRLKSAWKFRIADYRIIYEVQHKQLIIMVVAIEHRKDVYELTGR
jgi:mRNA interferase RelE/StbE